MCRKCSALRLRKYRTTPKGKEVFKEIMKRQYARHTDKYLARQSLNQALRRKNNPLIKPKLCEMCNKKKKLEGHHKDYTKRLEVKWICRQCHFNV